MRFRVDEKKVRYDIDNMSSYEKIGEGVEAVAYKERNNQVLKLYKPYSYKIKLDKETIDYLREIPTKRIIMPNASLIDKKKRISGYYMDYVEDLGFDSLLKLQREKLLEELKILREDLFMLNDKQVLIKDLTRPNTSFNKGIYFIDPGSFLVTEEDSNYAEGHNNEQINEYFNFELIFRYLREQNQKTASEYTKKIKKDYLDSGKYNYIDFILEDMKEDNLEEYINQKTK